MRIVAILVLVFACAAPAAAQGFPDKPVRVIVPYPPGGTSDFVARLLQNRLGAVLGQPVVVDNRGGATGAIGAEAVARSAPDGYTLCYTPGTDMVLRHFLMKNNPVDVNKDFTPIIVAVQSSSIIVANPSTPINSAKELIEFAKRNPGKLTYGTPGVGSNFHLAGELLKIHGVELTHVPYKGGGPALQAVLAGETMVSLMDFTTMLPHVKAGKLKGIALIDPKRHPALPDLPAMGEILPGYFMPESWFAFFGPAGMQPAVVARLNADVTRALNAPDVKPLLEERSLIIVAGPPSEVTRQIKNGFDVYGKVIKAAGIQPE
jgi:tripartite-type tricarboxylate transporter receptor subunit TctC